MSAEGLPIFFDDEVMLAGWTESHTAGAKITFWLSDSEKLDAFRHLTSRKGNTAGQRFACVLVKLSDQDEPEAVPKALGRYCAEAVGFCNRGEFQVWVTQCTAFAATAAGAKLALQQKLGIKTRHELDTDERVTNRWKQLKSDFHRHIHGDHDE